MTSTCPLCGSPDWDDPRDVEVLYTGRDEPCRGPFHDPPYTPLDDRELAAAFAPTTSAEVAKLADAPDSKSGGPQARVGSTPTLSTNPGPRAIIRELAERLLVAVISSGRDVHLPIAADDCVSAARRIVFKASAPAEPAPTQPVSP